MEETTTKPRLLLVDDDELLHTLFEGFTQDYYQTTTLNTGEALPIYLQTHNPDLIILDVMLPGENGWYWLNWLQDQYAHIPTIMLSVKGSTEDRIQGLQLGAYDYLPKPFDQQELLLRINNVLRCHKPAIYRTTLKFGSFIFDQTKETLRPVDAPQTIIPLSPTEARLIHFFYTHEGEVATRDMISLYLHGTEHNPLNRSIDVHIGRLRKKLDAHRPPATPTLIQTIRGKGYKYTDLR